MQLTLSMHVWTQTIATMMQTTTTTTQHYDINTCTTVVALTQQWLLEQHHTTSCNCNSPTFTTKKHINSKTIATTTDAPALQPTCHHQHINTILITAMSSACNGHGVAITTATWLRNDKIHCKLVDNLQQVTIAFPHGHQLNCVPMTVTTMQMACPRNMVGGTVNAFA